MDAYITLFVDVGDDGFSFVDWNDDGGNDRDARLITALESGTYYLAVEEYGGSAGRIRVSFNRYTP